MTLMLLLWPLLAATAGGGDYKPFVPATAGEVSAPLFVLIAYAAIWLVLLVFLASVWWRQRRVEEELHALRRRLDGQT